MKFAISVCSECIALHQKCSCIGCPCLDYPMREVEVDGDSIIKVGKFRKIDFERYMAFHGGQFRDPISWKVNNHHVGKRRNKKTHS